jgi:hypothetical protein
MRRGRESEGKHEARSGAREVQRGEGVGVTRSVH